MLPLTDKLLIGEAFVRCAVAWAIIRGLPYRWWRSALGMQAPSNEAPPGAPEDVDVVARVARAHARIAVRFRSFFTCLMLALSARDMLAARGVPSLIVLGVRLGNPKAGDAAPMAAHAWVVCGDKIVVGRETMGGHTPVAAYAKPKQGSYVRSR